jgi:hypothetical protein
MEVINMTELIICYERPDFFGGNTPAEDMRRRPEQRHIKKAFSYFKKIKTRRSKRMMMKIPPDMFCFGNPILISITELSRRENLNADISARRKNGNSQLKKRVNSSMDYLENETDGRRRCRCLIKKIGKSQKYIDILI